MIELFILAFFSLFSVVNPLGAIPLFLALTTQYSKQERFKTSLFTSIYFVILLVAFFWGGSIILSFFGISVSSLRIAGGLVILNSGYGLLSGKFTTNRVNKKVEEEALEKEDISFAPMAMPMLSGPGSISLLISLFSQYTEMNQRMVITVVIVALGLVVYLILRTSPLLFKILGHGGLKAISRIMGFLVMAIAVQYIVSGLVDLVNSFL